MGFARVRNQRGAGSIGCLFMVVVVAAAGYAAYQLGLPRLRHSSFDDRVTELMDNLRQRPDAEVQKEIIQIATDFDIALKPEQVKVTNIGGRLMIDVKYDKFVDLKFWQTTQSFHLNRSPAP